jgi:hypothetical protein
MMERGAPNAAVVKLQQMAKYGSLLAPNDLVRKQDFGHSR